jgi:HD-like signal output (HDOD) protein/DNA-binding response OmpR family regulator
MTDRNLTILLVEDSPSDRLLVQRVFDDPLQLAAPVTLEVVTDADAALAAVRRQRFALILTDHSLPGRTGLDFLQALRDAKDDTPVVVMTGTGDEHLAVAALQAGAADYVVKQLGFERGLPMVVERALRKRNLEVELASAQRQLGEHVRSLERRVEEQTRSLRRALQESEALRRIGCALAASRDIKNALDLVARTAGELVQAQASAVLIRAETEFVLATVSGALRLTPGLKSAGLPTSLSTDWPESAAATLRDDQEEIGLLWVGRARPEPFSVHERELLEALADMSALAIANVRAHERLRRRDLPVEPPPPAPPPPAAPPRSAPLDASALAVPPFPPVLARLVAMADEDEVTPEAMEQVVGMDAALTARVIQLTGAVGLHRARPASSMREALLVLGLRGVRNLAVALFARGQLGRRGPIDGLLWEQSLAAAAATQIVLEAMVPTLGDDGHLCGLLHNVGAIALHNAAPERYAEIVHLAVAGEEPPAALERRLLGVTAASVTQRLVRQWGLPRRIVATFEGVATGPLATVLRWGRARGFVDNPAWCALLGHRPTPSWLTRELESAEAALGMPRATVAALRERALARSAVLRGLVS